MESKLLMYKEKREMTDEQWYINSMTKKGNKVYLDVDGHLHREDGPAVEFVDGECHWYKHGELHRENGPAKYNKSSNEVEYWFNDKYYEPEEYKLLNRINIINKLISENI